jgi:6-phosphogluconolactonase
MLDERLVPEDHPECNFRLVQEHLGNRLPQSSLHRFKYDAVKPMRGIDAYWLALQRYGGTFDITLASSGEDGHIAALFPSHHSVERRGDGFFLIEDSPKPPAGRMTAGFELVCRTDTGVLLFFGAGKRNALRNFFNIHLSYLECPAKIMTKMSRYYVLTDQEVDTP